MGYMGLERVGESDMAAGVKIDVSSSVLKVLKKEFENTDDNGEYNTPPILNVAMNLNELMSGYSDYFLESDDFRIFVWKVVLRLEKYIKESIKNDFDYSYISGCEGHLNTLRKIINKYEEETF
tara:strand:+ start:767 stop:1135 length:369 start_codon:yes stop_codon:yes gene_type:complete